MELPNWIKKRKYLLLIVYPFYFLIKIIEFIIKMIIKIKEVFKHDSL